MLFRMPFRGRNLRITSPKIKNSATEITIVLHGVLTHTELYLLAENACHIAKVDEVLQT